MKSEEKQELLKALSGYFPYNVKVKVGKYIATVCEMTRHYFCIESGGERYYPIEEFRPYLRPLSEITEEETKKLCSFTEPSGFVKCADITDYLLSIHVDIYGLLDRNLAFLATPEMYQNK